MTCQLPKNNNSEQVLTLDLACHGVVFGLFASLAVILTWPLVLQMESSSSGDGFIYLQAFWWFKKALLTMHNPFVTDYVFYPQGANLAFNSGVFSSFLMTLPVSLFWGIPQAINCSHLLSFTLSGYFTFLLAYELFRNKEASFLAGLIYAYIPYHINHFPGQLNLSELQWIPLYLFLLKKTLEQDKWLWPILGGASAVVIMLTDSIQLVVIILLSLLVVIGLLAGRELNRGAVARLSVMVGSAVLLGSGYLWQVALFLMESHDSLVVGLFDHGGANMFSADLAGFVTPKNTHYLGYVPILLSVYGGWRLRRELWGRILLAATMVGIVLSLGPTLHLNGQWQQADGSYLKLPFAYLSGMPLFSEVRTPYRFHMITALGVALLAGNGFGLLCQRLHQSRMKSILVVVCCALILVEYCPGKRKYEQLPPTPEIYKEIAQQKGEFTVLQLPLSRWSALVRNGPGGPHLLQYYQLTHGKKIFGGLVTRASNQRLDFHDEVLETIVYINSLERYEIFEKRRLPTSQEIEEVRAMAITMRFRHGDFAINNRLRYVVLHDHAARLESLSRVFLEEFLQKKIVNDQMDGTGYIKL
jgi:hypothetical protein